MCKVVSGYEEDFKRNCSRSFVRSQLKYWKEHLFHGLSILLHEEKQNFKWNKGL